MLVLAALASLTLSFAIAAVSVGGTVSSLERRPRRIRYDVENAVDAVVANLPADVSAQISFDDVRAVIDAQLDFLATLGMASVRTDQNIVEDLRIVDENDALAWVLGDLDRHGVDMSDEQVAAVLAAEAGYRRSIGMAGPALGSIEG